MAARLTVAEAADTARRHPVTVRKALEAGELHGTQRVKRGRWTIRLECLDAWLDQVPCPHKAPSVTDLNEYRAARTPA